MTPIPQRRDHFYYWFAGASNTTAAAHTAGALITLRMFLPDRFRGGSSGAWWGMKPTPIGQTFDYGFENGIGIKGHLRPGSGKG